MYVKVINPATHGKAAYDNRGSSAQTLNYLKQEAAKDSRKAVFFNVDNDDLCASKLQENIDTNVKGLRTNDAKFYSLVFSPSPEELAHIGNKEDQLRAYARELMQQYAANFQLKDGRKLSSKDLVWGATIHQDRSYRGTDPEVTAGAARVGEKRPGLQTHLHVIVSARDAGQKITLNPTGRRERFNLIAWQTGAGQQFEKQFNYVAQEREKLHPKLRDTRRDAARAARIGERVENINRLVPPEQQLNSQRVQQIAASREYDKSFYRLLSRVEGRAREGRPIDNAYQLLTTGREQPPPQLTATTTLHALQQALHAGTKQNQQTEQISEKKGRHRDELDIEM